MGFTGVDVDRKPYESGAKMTTSETAIEAYRAMCESHGIECDVRYGVFENGDNVRVTTVIKLPMAMAQWEEWYAAKERLVSETGLVRVNDEEAKA